MIKRMRIALDYIVGSVKKIDGSVNPFYNRIMSEMLAEIKLMPPELVEFYLSRIGEMFLWAATGEGEFPMPPEYQDMI